MSKVRTAIIGCGKVGQIHGEAHMELPESELIAVCDADAARAKAFSQRYGGRPYTDAATMIAEANLQAVSICTPHPLHAEPAILSAEAGVNVLVEKPLAASLKACDDMIAASRKGGVKLSLISQRRLYEPVVRMKEAINAGKIGQPVLGVYLMFNWRDEAYYQSDPWRGKWDTEGGGVLVNQSAHHLDLLQWLMGDIQEISGYWANVNHPFIKVDDTAVAAVRFKGGGLGAIAASVSQKPGIYTKLHIHGSNGASVGVETDRGASFVAGVSEVVEPPLNDLWTIPGEEHLLAKFEAKDRTHFKTINATIHYHALQIKDFLQAIIEERKPLISGEDGRIAVEMFTAIYRSNRERRAIQFPLIAENDD